MDVVGIESFGRFHCRQSQHLDHMVLKHVAQQTGVIEIVGATLHAQGFCDGDLHMINITRVPERLENDVGKARDYDVLNRLFSEIMVDAEKLFFLCHGFEKGVQTGRGSGVRAERFF